jgi:hypothetical protein
MFIPARRGVKGWPCATEIAVKILPIIILEPTGLVKQCCWYDIVFMMDDGRVLKAKMVDGPRLFVSKSADGVVVSCWLYPFVDISSYGTNTTVRHDRCAGCPFFCRLDRQLVKSYSKSARDRDDQIKSHGMSHMKPTYAYAHNISTYILST